ncbi:MAG: DUF1285 domain-containing protein [Myxococcales bacterium]|nr:DUF1285 domain-containing protein [Myxococcales bacterium]
MDLEKLRRNSLIHVRKDGTFFHDGQPIENPKIVTLFRRGIRIRDDGEKVLHVGPQWCYVTSDDVVLFVESVSVDEQLGTIRVRLWNGEEDLVSPQSLQLLGDGQLVGTLETRPIPVRFFRSAYHQIAAYWEEDAGSPSGYIVKIGPRTWPLLVSSG